MTGICSHGRRGFTLLEMSIVLVIMGVIVTSFVTVLSAAMQKRQYQDTLAKMETIQKTLYDYRVAFDRLPCPGDGTIAINNASFGVEANNQGTCTGGAISANYAQTPAVNNRDAVEGMVPVRTLRLGDEYAYDGWGRRFMYAVSKDATQVGAFTVISGFDTSTRMNILNTQHTAKSNLAMEVLISFGPDGHGAFQRSGGATRVSSGSTNSDQLENCDCNSSAATTNLNAQFIQKDASQNPADKLDTFDDLLVFTTRMDYILPASLISQPFDASGGGGSGGGGAGGSTVTAGGCFPAGTHVLTPKGETPIETLAAGDEVIAVDEQGKPHKVHITETFKRNSRILVVKTDDGSLRTTAGHYMWLGGKLFRPAGQLKTGDTIMMVKDSKPQATTVRTLRFEKKSAPVYNMELDDLHTFVAGGFIVHNVSVVSNCGVCSTTNGITTCECAY